METKKNWGPSKCVLHKPNTVTECDCLKPPSYTCEDGDERENSGLGEWNYASEQEKVLL